MRKKIFAAGYFGRGNFGDELILEIFTKRMPEVTVTHVPRMKTKPLAVIASIAGSEAVVFPGGSVFQDETSSLSLFFYAGVILFAVLLGKPVFLLDSGFEVRKSFNKAILGRILKRASFISVRDSASFELLRSLGLSPFKSADCAFSLEDFQCRRLSPPKTIGVIPRGAKSAMKEAMAECLKKWPEAEFKFAAMSPGDLAEAQALSGGRKAALIQNLSQAEAFFRACDFFILMPYHSLVLALLGDAEFKAVTYSAKTANLLRGIEESRGKSVKLFRIAEEYAFQIFENLLKDKLKP